MRIILAVSAFLKLPFIGNGLGLRAEGTHALRSTYLQMLLEITGFATVKHSVTFMLYKLF